MPGNTQGLVRQGSQQIDLLVDVPTQELMGTRTS